MAPAHGILDVAIGEFISLVRERSRQDDCTAFVAALGQGAPRGAQAALLVWDSATPYHPKRVAAFRAHVTAQPLSLRSPALLRSRWPLGSESSVACTSTTRTHVYRLMSHRSGAHSHLGGGCHKEAIQRKNSDCAPAPLMRRPAVRCAMCEAGRRCKRSRCASRRIL